MSCEGFFIHIYLETFGVGHTHWIADKEGNDMMIALLAKGALTPEAFFNILAGLREGKGGVGRRI